jgi:hypothetical protein
VKRHRDQDRAGIFVSQVALHEAGKRLRHPRPAAIFEPERDGAGDVAISHRSAKAVISRGLRKAAAALDSIAGVIIERQPAARTAGLA